jgi:hypothetical protein
MPNFDKANPPIAPASKLFLLQRAVVFCLASLLVFYHSYTLFDLYIRSGTDLYGGPSGNGYAWYAHTQSLLRLLIIASLVFVALNKRLALYGMWIGIGSLVATHFWAHFFDLPFPWIEGRHPLSYLKGFIIPTIITLLHFAGNRHGNLRQRTV